MDARVLDVRGLACPLPVLKANKAMKGMDGGESLRVLATDPGAVKDFKAYCETTGTELVESSEEQGVYSFLLRKPV